MRWWVKVSPREIQGEEREREAVVRSKVLVVIFCCKKLQVMWWAECKTNSSMLNTCQNVDFMLHLTLLNKVSSTMYETRFLNKVSSCVFCIWLCFSHTFISKCCACVGEDVFLCFVDLHVLCYVAVLWLSSQGHRRSQVDGSQHAMDRGQNFGCILGCFLLPGA